MNPNTTSASAATIAARLAKLPKLSWPELKAMWTKLYGGEPPISNRRFVERRLAYKIQEIEFRKVDPNLLARNERRIDALIATGNQKRDRRGAPPVPGTVLLREYNGIEHRVTVTTDGQYEYRGRLYRSLSVIAREITGTRWSGPLFFGLRNRSARKARA
jgi:hypothetical protein